MSLFSNHSRLFALMAFVLVVALSRLLPHPPNVSPIAAIALFGGAGFVNKHWAFILPLLAMLISDVALEITTGYGFHSLMPVVYAAFIITVGLGMLIKKRVTPMSVITGSVAASILFFGLTNFAVWAQGGLYPQTFDGLIACYVAAIPFFGNTLFGNLIYAGILFGGWAIMENKFPVLASPRTATA